MKTSIIVGDVIVVEGIESGFGSTLQDIRKQLEDKGYTEVRTLYKGGKHIVEFITRDVSNIKLIDAGLIRGTKAEREEYKTLTKTPLEKKNNLGYSYEYIFNPKENRGGDK